MNLFAVKPLSRIIEESEGEHALKKTLTATSLVALGIGAIIGAGLFSLTGIAAAHHAGPAVTIAFALAAFGCVFAGLCYSEFATMIPIAGSAYTYSYATMGELMAWIIGWDLVLEYAVGASTVAVSWAGYVQSFLGDFGLKIPMQLLESPVKDIKFAPFEIVWGPGMINLPAVIVVIAISMLLMIGIQESSRVNAIVVALKVTVVIVFIIAGWSYINPVNYQNYIPAATGVDGEFGWGGIVRAAGVVFFAFIGFDAVSTAAQEAKNPQRDMPIGIIGSLAVCTILYVLFAHVLTGIVNYKLLDTAAPVALAIDKTPYLWLRPAIKIAIIAGYTSVILVMLLGQSRVFYSMSRDGLLPGLFSKIHPKWRTPYVSNLVFMVFVGCFAAFAPIKIVGEMTSIGTLFAFVLVCIGIMVMRKTHPHIERPFKTPLVPIVPILGILVNLYLMWGLGRENWFRLFIWMGMGLAVYFLYSRKNSRLVTHPVGAGAK